MRTQQTKRRNGFSFTGMTEALCLLFVWSAPAALKGQEYYSVNSASRSSSSSNITLDYEGFTEPLFDVLVAATEIGRLENVQVGVGQSIEEGHVIATLESGLQKEAVATAKFRAEMRGELIAATAEANRAESRLSQVRDLANQKMAVPDEVAQAVSEFEIAKARAMAAQEQISLREQELSRFELQLRRRQIRSPMRGVVADVFHGPGEYITPADPAVVRLLNLDQLYGVFNIPVEEMAGIRRGVAVTVNLMSHEKPVPGKIAMITPEIDGESGTVKVKVILDNAARNLMSGDRCQMKVAPLRPTAGDSALRSQGSPGVDHMRHQINQRTSMHQRSQLR